MVRSARCLRRQRTEDVDNRGMLLALADQLGGLGRAGLAAASESGLRQGQDVVDLQFVGFDALGHRRMCSSRFLAAVASILRDGHGGRTPSARWVVRLEGLNAGVPSGSTSFLRLRPQVQE